LREDLGQAIPRADTPLDEIEHPLLVEAAEQFTDDETSHECIAAIDDRVLFKVKIQRWRGAVWIDGEGGPWLVSAGHREDGLPDDFCHGSDTFMARVWHEGAVARNLSSERIS
jgi:hypothetical protein